MASSLSADLKASIAWLFQDTQQLSTVSDAARLEFAASLVNGDGSGEADALWHDERTVDDFSFDDLDLTDLGGTLFGAPRNVSLAAVKALLLVNLATDSDGVLQLGAASANVWSAPFNTGTSTIEVPPGSCLLLVNQLAGWPVGSSNRMLRIGNPHEEPASYRIALIGVSS